VAEGCGRSGEAELARFLNIAMGSASALEYQLLLARDLKLLDLDADEHQSLSGDVYRGEANAHLLG
jgi:four helix bundle protein